MGALIICDGPGLVPRPRTPFAGTVIEACEKAWPDGLQGRTLFGWVDGRRLKLDAGAVEAGTDDFECVLGEGETLALAAWPAFGYDIPAWVWYLYAAVIVASVAAVVLLQPSIPGQNQGDAPSKVYSIGAQANEARLGDIVPRPFGRVVRVPEYASQSWRRYEGNKEIRHFLLVVGAGDHQVEDVRIGELSSADLSPGTLSWSAFRPSQHRRQMGWIRQATGIHENVVTSSEVDRQELLGRTKYTTDSASVTLGNTRVQVSPQEARDQIEVGDKLRYDDNIKSPDPSIERNVVGLDGEDVLIDSPFLEPGSKLAVFGYESVKVGPMVASPPGTVAERIEVDIEFPRGLYKQDDDGDFSRVGVQFGIWILEVDDSGEPVMNPQTGQQQGYYFTHSEYASTSTPQRRTLGWDIPNPRRFQVTVSRLDDPQVLSARDATQSLWTGLRAFLPEAPASQDLYGPVTLLAVTLTGTEQVSSAAQQRIGVVSRSILPRLAAPGNAPTANPADHLFEIVTDDTVGGAQPVSLLDMPELEAFAESQAGRSGFNGVFDRETTVWEAMRAVCGVAFAEPVLGGGGLRVAVDGPRETRTQAVTVDALRAPAKLTYSWRKAGDPDGVEVEWWDPKDFSRRQTRWPAACVRPEKVAKIGLADEAEALAHAKYEWAQRIYRNAVLDLPMEWAPMTLSKYDRIGVALPEFDWGRAGWVTEVAGLVLTLSVPVPEGALCVSLRGQDGAAEGPLAATGLGGKRLVLDQAPAIDLVTAGAVPTLAAFAAGGAAEMRDFTVERVTPGDGGADLRARPYDPRVFEGRV